MKKSKIVFLFSFFAATSVISFTSFAENTCGGLGASCDVGPTVVDATCVSVVYAPTLGAQSVDRLV